jgi:hypothetical protein
MTDNIALPRAVVEKLRASFKVVHGTITETGWALDCREELAVLDAALAEEKETFAQQLTRRSWEAHRAALAEPEQKPEPVAWLWKDGFRFLGGIEPKDGSELPLYAAPPQPDAKREPATAEQVAEADAKSIEADAKRYADSLTIAEYAAALAEAGWSAESIADALRARGSK